MEENVINIECPGCGAPGKAGCVCEYCGKFIPYPEGMSPASHIIAETKYTVVLQNSGRAKLRVIKVVTETLHRGLKESKYIADHAPITLVENVSKEEANALKIALENCGASVEIK